MHFPSAACNKFTRSCTQRQYLWKMHVFGMFGYLLVQWRFLSAARAVTVGGSLVWQWWNGPGCCAGPHRVIQRYSVWLQLAEIFCISAVYSISDVYRNTEYGVSLIQRYSVSSSYTLWIFPFPKTVQLINRHKSLSSSFSTNNHLPTSFFFSSVSPIKHQRLRLLHTPEEPPRLTPSSELSSSCTCRIKPRTHDRKTASQTQKLACRSGPSYVGALGHSMSDHPTFLENNPYHFWFSWKLAHL